MKYQLPNFSVVNLKLRINFEKKVDSIRDKNLYQLLESCSIGFRETLFKILLFVLVKEKGQILKLLLVKIEILNYDT